VTSSGTSPPALADATASDVAGVRTVAILADDLIWATRLADMVRGAGAAPRMLRRAEDLDALLRDDAAPALAVIVDLTARAYDGVAAIGLASAAGARVAAVGQHDDAALRRAATEAGAARVFTYRALFEDGARLIERWLAA
jgi:hypothetical protein